jgi:hypothetical protein
MYAVPESCEFYIRLLFYMFFSTGLYMEGIYKVPGIKSKVQHLRRLYNLREAVQLSDFELPVVTSLLKQFLRLPSLIV